LRYGGIVNAVSGHAELPASTKGAATDAIPLPPFGEAVKRRWRERPNRSLVTVSTGAFVFVAVVLALLCAGGYGWFTWRKLSLPTNPELLRAKANEGDAAAMATLGLSLVRGEWGAGLDTDEGIRLIEASARADDPFGLLALGWLRREGYATAVGAAADNETEAWRRALSVGLADRLASGGDSRWRSLAGVAAAVVEGADSAKAIEWLQRADRRKYPEAAATLAAISTEGIEREKWFLRAAQQAQHAVRRDSVFARRLLGELHSDKTFAGADPHLGFNEIERAAEAGEPRAQLLLAALLDERGSQEKAFEWTERAAEAGLLPAKAALAERYLRGRGTPPQPQRAVSLAEEVAARGNPLALRVLAAAYAEGIGVERSTERAIRYLRNAVGHGDHGAVGELGKLLAESGKGSEAESPLRSAALAGDIDAALSLGHLLSVRSDDASHAEAVQWLETALAQGRPEAALVLADALDNPERSDRNPERVVELLQSLADEGDHVSAVRLCHYLIEGRGVEANPARALLLARKAADAGEKSAFFLLGQLYEQGVGDITASPAAALDAYREAIMAGDGRVHQRFPGLSAAPTTAASFIRSWGLPNHAESMAFLAESVESYFHLERPDAARIASMEAGFRQIWQQRSVETDAAENITLEALDHIRLEIPFRFVLSREHWRISGRSVATVELREQAGGAWSISRFTETTRELEFDPDRANFESSRGSEANSRRIFPALTPEEAAYDLANLPRGQVERVKALPFIDKFGVRHTLLPTALRDDVIVFSRIQSGGDILLPVAYFDPVVLHTITSMADAQSFDAYEALLAQLVDAPDPGDPQTAALLQAANRGEHEAEALVGEHYYDGIGTFPLDRVEALKWFVKSAQGRHPLGRYWIAIMAGKGEITASDPPHTLYRDALPDLAEIIARSEAKAPYWRATAECYAGGESVSLGTRQPRQLLERAIQSGDLRAQLLLGEHLIESNSLDGLRYLRYASDARCASAATVLAKYYLGRGNDPRLAPDLLRAAAVKHDIEAQILLGVCLAEGTGTQADPGEAAFWLRLAWGNAIRLANKNGEVQARETIRRLTPVVGEDHFRRAANFLERKNR